MSDAQPIFDCRNLYYYPQKGEYYKTINSHERAPNYKEKIPTLNLGNYVKMKECSPPKHVLLETHPDALNLNINKGNLITNSNNVLLSTNDNINRLLLDKTGNIYGGGNNFTPLYNNTNMALEQYNKTMPSSVYSFGTNVPPSNLPTNQVSTVTHMDASAIRNPTDGYNNPYNVCDGNQHQAALRGYPYMATETDNRVHNNFGFDANNYVQPNSILSENSAELCSKGTRINNRGY